MAETRDPLTVADEALAANVMTGSLDETTLTLTTRNGQAIRGVFQHSFLTDEQIRRLIEARRYVPAGGNADDQMRLASDGKTIEWFRPTPIPERVQLGPNLLDAEIPASTSNTYNLNDEIRLDKTFYFFQFGNEYFTIPASSDPLDSNGGSFVLSERTITITRGFDRPLRGIFFFIGAGLQGIRGERGFPGQGVPVGGEADQVLTKVDGANYNTEWRDNSASGADVKPYAETGGRAITASDTDFTNRLTPNPSSPTAGNAGISRKVPVVNDSNTGYELIDGPIIPSFPSVSRTRGYYLAFYVNSDSTIPSRVAWQSVPPPFQFGNTNVIVSRLSSASGMFSSQTFTQTVGGGILRSELLRVIITDSGNPFMFAIPGFSYGTGFFTNRRTVVAYSLNSGSNYIKFELRRELFASYINSINITEISGDIRITDLYPEDNA